jgi:hypothetical protein
MTEDGRWELDRTRPAVRRAREAARKILEEGRVPLDPSVLHAWHARQERAYLARKTRFSGMSRAVLRAFPVHSPEAIAIADMTTRVTDTFVGPDEIPLAVERLRTYDVIAGIDIRNTLRCLRIDARRKWICELAVHPGRSLGLANEPARTVIACVLTGTFGPESSQNDEAALAMCWRSGALHELRRRITEDARLLGCLFAFGRLHGEVFCARADRCLRVDVGWSHEIEDRLHSFIATSVLQKVPIEVTFGLAPFDAPFTNAQPAWAERIPSFHLLTQHGEELPTSAVTAARMLV